MKSILAFAGSNSKNSINAAFIKAVASKIDFCETEELSLLDYQLPIYSIDYEKENGFPNDVTVLNRIIQDAHGYIISTPEHNGSLPAVFKNVIDWVSRINANIFNDKPMILLSTSPGGRGGLSALGHAEAILSRRGANVIGSYAFGNFNDRFNQGELDEAAKLELSELLSKLEEEIQS